MLSDDVFKALKSEAERRHVTVADIVRRGIDRQLESAVPGTFRKPTITPCDLGEPKIPVELWREVANEPRFP